MSYLTLKDINKIYPNGFHAVHNFNLEIDKGEFIVFVGPSGCGKSTTLRMIAGLEDISNGEFLINGKRANELGPREREVAMVFQSYALYPQMTVFDNIAFGLTLQGVDEEVIEEKVKNTARILGLTDYLDRLPRALSGGQRQRVAMGRSIVRNPKVFLFDEPLSNLDAKLRGATRREILLLHKRLRATMLYVTHDQTEALTLADRIVCMSMGHVQQVGTPLELYDSPANVFVASFIGLPPMNFYDVRVGGDKLTGAGFQVSLTPEEQHTLRAYQNKEITLGVRPENIVEGADVPVTVSSNENLGMNTLVHGHIGGLKTAGAKISAKLKGWRDYKVGDTASFTFERKHFFDKETTNAIRGGE